METSVHYALKQKQLCLKLRESIVTDPDLELRFGGLLNTATGGFQHRTTLKKFVSAGAAPRVKGEGTQPLRLGGGLGLESRSGNEPFLTLSAKKAIAVFDGPDTVLTAHAAVDYDLRTRKPDTRVGVKLSHRMLNFTQRQDLKLTLGLDFDLPASSTSATTTGSSTGSSSGRASRSKPSLNTRPDVYLRLKENNWAVHFRRNQWKLTYDL